MKSKAKVNKKTGKIKKLNIVDSSIRPSPGNLLLVNIQIKPGVEFIVPDGWKVLKKTDEIVEFYKIADGTENADDILNGYVSFFAEVEGDGK